ncbi:MULTISPECIES: bacteriocin-like protein [Chryseobacterium]
MKNLKKVSRQQLKEVERSVLPE